jgi:hypothetical protein
MEIMLRRCFILLFLIFQIKSAKSNSAVEDSVECLYTEWSVDGYTSYYSNFVGDTIINSTSYKIFRNKVVTIPGLFPNPFTGPGFYDFYMRYDSINEIEYFLNGPFERVLYNYSIIIGDTLENSTVPFILTSIDSILLEDLSYRKRFLFKDAFNDSIIWIKGIGNLCSPIDPAGIYGINFILCYQEKGNLIYQYQDLVPIQCDNYVPVNEIQKFTSINYFPNPFRDILNISSSEKIEKIEVLNMTGQKILIVSPKDQNVFVDLSKFNDGTYFLKVILKNGTIIFNKIFKMS